MSSTVLTQHVLHGIHAVVTAPQAPQALVSNEPVLATRAIASEAVSNQKTTTDQCDTIGDGDDNLITNQPSTRLWTSKRISKYNIHLPRWIWARGCQVLLEHSNRSWGFTLRVYNRVSDNSDIMKAVRGNDCNMIRALFDSGQASPYDILDYSGSSLLTRAVIEISIDALELLLSYDLNSLWTIRVFCICWQRLRSAIASRDMIDFVNVTVLEVKPFRQILGHLYAVTEIDSITFGLICASFDAVEVSSILQSIFPWHSTSTRLLCLDQALMLGLEDPEVFWLLLSPRLSPGDYFASHIQSEGRVDHQDLWRAAARRVLHARSEKKALGWRRTTIGNYRLRIPVQP